jgi:hypothetical protein
MREDDEFEALGDEEEPESLRKKWEAEEISEFTGGKSFRPCPHCGQRIETKSFFCLYCGQRVFSDSGLLGKLNHGVSTGKFKLVVLGLIAAFILLWILF